jgi:hypothetical protein
MSGAIAMGTNKITGLGAATAANDALSTANLEENPTNGVTVKAPTSNWAYDHENNTTTPHGAVSAATASKLVVRDASARAKFAEGVATGDAIVFSQLASAATASKVVVRDGSGNAKFAASAADGDAVIHQQRKDFHPPAQISYLNGFASGSYNIQCQGVAHSDTDARIDAIFHVKQTGTYRFVITHTTDTINVKDDATVYAGKMADGAAGNNSNLFNGSTTAMDLQNAAVQAVVQTETSSFSLTAGDIVFFIWIKGENEGAGNLYIYAVELEEV